MTIHESPQTMIRRADFRPSTFNPDRRTVDVVFSTGAAVDRRDARGAYSEILSLDAAHVDLSRLDGAHVLDGHRLDSVGAVIGVVEGVRLENGQGIATLRLDDNPDVIRKVRDGILRHVSVGYRVTRWQDGTDSSGRRTRTAVAWQPFEISFVNVAADAGATIRSEPTMTTENVQATDDHVPNQRTLVDQQIRDIGELAGLTREWSDFQIKADATVEQTRAAAFAEMQRRGNVNIRVQQNGPSGDDPAVIMTRRTDALAARVMGTAPSDAARAYMHDGLADHARGILAMRGESTTGLPREGILTRAAQHTLSDFPNLLTGVGNRVLMSTYQTVPNALKSVARQATLPDFRAKSSLRLGEVGRLERVNESGEVTHISRAEVKESYSLETFGTMFSLSRKAVINDDLGAFRDWAVAAGRAAAETEGQELIALLIQGSGAGPVMEDGNRLFHTDHGNLADTAGSIMMSSDISAEPMTPLVEARLAMRMQKGLDGVTPINAQPKFLVVPADLETEAEQALAQIYPMAASDTNPFSGRLNLLVEPRLPAAAWYVFADPAVLPVLEYAHLSSAQGPQIASREGWDVLGMEFRVILDFGAGAVDWRGAYRNPGAA